jgi:hypothetical protein
MEGVQMKQVLISSSESNAVCTTKVTSQEDFENKNIVPQHRIIEDFLTLWLHSNTDTFGRYHENSITYLQSIGNSIKVFDNGKECSDFLHNVKNNKVYLILSDAFDIMNISLIHDAPQLDFIYILCEKTTNYEHLIKEWRKIRGVFSDISVICNQIKTDIRRHEHKLTPFSVISASYPVNMNELDPTFMYSQLLKEILLELQNNKEVRQEFINFLRIQYAENAVVLSSIDKFEEDYDIHPRSLQTNRASLLGDSSRNKTDCLSRSGHIKCRF